MQEHFEAVAIDLCHLFDLDDEVTVALITDQIGQQVAHASTAHRRELALHGDDDVLRRPTYRDSHTCRFTLGTHVLGELGRGHRRLSLVSLRGLVSGGLDGAGPWIAATAPAATSSCQSTKNCGASVASRSSTVDGTVM